jgi:DNA repair protein SbcD/Mre11
MKILHTADWHIGKRLGRFDRMAEHELALDRVREIADEEDVDLVLVSGDVFDRPVPPMDALALGLRTLLSLGSKRPVVAVAGNHDSPELFEALAPLLGPHGVHMIGDVKSPDRGGVLGPEQVGVDATIACFPFLREGRVVDFMRDAGDWYSAYAEKIAAICARYNEDLARASGTVPILMAHFLVQGAAVRRGAPRGERELHMGEAYAATPQAIPAGPQYVAMGHIHAPQPVPSSPVPAEYAGSLLPLDFGEAGETKRVVIVDVEPGRLATTRSVEIAAGRPLVHLEDTWDRIEARAPDLSDVWLDLTVKAHGADPGLFDRAHSAFPHLVRVRVQRPQTQTATRTSKAGRSWEDLYTDYYRAARGVDPSPELVSALRVILEEADATA